MAIFTVYTSQYVVENLANLILVKILKWLPIGFQIDNHNPLRQKRGRTCIV